MLTIDWGNHDDSLLIIKQEYAITPENLVEGLQLAYLMIGHQPHIVDTIVDVRLLRAIPTKLVHLLLDTFRYPPINSGTMIIITDNVQIEDTFVSLARFSGQRILCVDTVDAAYVLQAAVSHKRMSLPAEAGVGD